MSEHMKQPHEPVSPELVTKLVEGAQILIPEDGIFEKMKSAELSGQPLRVKMGFDPTSPDLHLGHAVSMHQLRKFQELGHLPVIIIGDYTGRIGDPTGRNKSRPLADPAELEKNAATYIAQLGKVLDTSKIEVHYNSEWLGGMDLSDVITLLSQGTLSQIISRDDFRQRLESGSPIALHEIIYPFLQGMDSVAISADIEVGGVDQLYAFQAGRTLQSNKGDDPQALVLMPLLRGLDGQKKMSKSLGNYIGLADKPRDMFGKIMSIPDSLLEEYFKLASTLGEDEIEEALSAIVAGANPMEAKLLLAQNITSIYHGAKEASAASHYFDKQFRDKKEDAREYITHTVSGDVTTFVELLTSLGVVDSNSKARRLIEQGGVKINGKKVTEETALVIGTSGEKIQVGKRNFFKVTRDTSKTKS